MSRPTAHNHTISAAVRAANPIHRPCPARLVTPRRRTAGKEEPMATTTRRRSTPNGSSDGSNRRAGRPSPQPKLGQRGPELQPFGKLRLLPIALSTAARSESCRLLNEILADTTILYALYKKAHWNAAGPTFYQLHLLFDKHAGEQLELVDLLAERVQSLGGIALGDPRHAAELTSIDRPPDGAEDVPAMIHRLLDAHETVIDKVRRAIKKTEKSGDWGSNDLLMSDVLRRHELHVWFVAEHIVDVPLIEP
jgi:starvation-inducible DNA-binding protein